MSNAQTVSLVQRFQTDFINGHHVDALDTLLDENFTIHLAGMPTPVQGRKVFKQMAAGYFTAFPDLHEEADLLLADGDRVAAHVTWTGTHLGEFGGIPATGKKVRVTGMRIFRVANGRIAEEWSIDDMMGLMQQLGVMPTPA